MNSTLILKHVDTDGEYGVFGDTTLIFYENGEVAQVGDIVEIINKEGKSYGSQFICKDVQRGGFAMSIADCYNEGNYKQSNWDIRLVSKFYHQTCGDTCDGIKIVESKPTKKITIDGKEIYLSIESFNALKEQLC